jgi:hypothetical protein
MNLCPVIAGSGGFSGCLGSLQISKQYVNQDNLEYIRSLIPEEIVKKTRIEIEDKGSRINFEMVQKRFHAMGS